MQLDELSEAEDALAEANILNNSDPEVWAYLCLVCLKTGRQVEAEQAYKYAIKVRTELFPLDLLSFFCSRQKRMENASGWCGCCACVWCVCE